MPQLYLQEYVQELIGRRVCIACREGILRDNFNDILSDIKFLARHNIQTTLFFNLPNRFANQKLIKALEKKLPNTNLVRIAPEADFYEAVLNHPDAVFKLIFLERRFLIDSNGYKINALTTERLRNALSEFGDAIANINFKDAMNTICEKIEAGLCDRVHILPAGKNSIKHELFTIEGTGTMIANNFEEEFRPVLTDEDVAIVARILGMYKKAGFLRPRSKDYVSRHRDRFYVTAIDSIIVGCVEKKIVDAQTVELGALAISTRFRNQRVGVYTVNKFVETMAAEGYLRFVSLTRNPRLQALLGKLGFAPCNLPEYQARRDESPGVPMYYRSLAD